MVLGTRISFAQFLQATVLLSTVSCRCCEDGGPPEPPPQSDAPIASVEIIPNQVSVLTGEAFVLRARVKDEWGNVLPDGRAAKVLWTTSGQLTIDNRPASSVVVTATPTTTPPTPPEIYVIASVDGVEKADSSRIEIISQPDALHDWILSEHTPSPRPPSFAFVSGQSNYGESVPRVNSLVSFVRNGVLEPFECPAVEPRCGVLTIFAPDRGLMRVPVEWKPGCDVAGFSTPTTLPTNCTQVAPAIPTPLPQPITIPVQIWVLSKGIDRQVNADKAYADWVFDQPLMGFKLDIRVNPYANVHTPITRGLGCKTTDGAELPAVLAATTPVRFEPKKITVVYVDAINPGTGDEVGFTCPYDGANGTGTLVVVSADGINNSTLAHELGHALGQWHSADRDHPDVPAPRLEGFEPSNLMWSSESDWGTSLRRNLTLGQLFQVNLADFSFVKRSGISPTPGLPCATDAGSNAPCPFLARDQR